jgi:hypothetical protein
LKQREPRCLKRDATFVEILPTFKGKNALATLSIYKKLAPELRNGNSLNYGTKSVAMAQ